MTKGWYGHRQAHSLASKGIRTRMDTNGVKNNTELYKYKEGNYIYWTDGKSWKWAVHPKDSNNNNRKSAIYMFEKNLGNEWEEPSNLKPIEFIPNLKIKLKDAVMLSINNTEEIDDFYDYDDYYNDLKANTMYYLYKDDEVINSVIDNKFPNKKYLTREEKEELAHEYLFDDDDFLIMASDILIERYEYYN